MHYMAVIEKSDNGYAAYVPDLPGCIAAGDTVDETETLIREAIRGHLEMLREIGEPEPTPEAHYAMVEA